jgi:hypothetical protein
MKRISLLLIITLLHFSAMSQSREGTVDYQKTRQHAAIIELPYSTEVLEGAFKDIFSKQGAKKSESKGFQVFRSARLEEGSSNPLYDLYFKIDRKSRKEKDISIVYLTVAHPGENIAVRLADDRYGQDDAKAFLNMVTPKVEAYNLELQINAQEEEIKKADKKYNSLVADSIDFQKKKLTLEEKIAANSKSQEEQRKETARQREISEALKGRRQR